MWCLFKGDRLCYETCVRERLEGVRVSCLYYGTGFMLKRYYHGLTPLSLEDAQKQKEISRKEIQKLMEEKQQALSDLNSMEKSFSDLFKRLEKQKDALEGYHRVR